MNQFKKFMPLIALILVFQGVSAFIGINTSPSGDDWYSALSKAELNPPGWAFGVVWPLLYLMMAISVWLIWQDRTKTGASAALTLFGAHMLLNWSWNFIFFEFQMIAEAFFLLIAILILAAILTVWFFNIRRTAGLLLIPYVIWVSFATYLSGTIFILN